MTIEEVYNVISEHFLVARRLPFEVISVWSYRDKDEEKLGGFNGKPIYLEGGKILNATREIITGYGNFPPDRKFIKETKIVEKGGWWYVKQVKDTGSTVIFNREYDKFFAPTLEEAVTLYLNSLK